MRKSIIAALAATALFATAALPSFADGIWQSDGNIYITGTDICMRVVYDQTVPGAHAAANNAVWVMAQEQGAYWLYLPTCGEYAAEYAYSESMNGVQVQVYTYSDYLGSAFIRGARNSGVPMKVCAPYVDGCPAWYRSESY